MDLSALLPLTAGPHTLSLSPDGALLLVTRDDDGSICGVREQPVDLPPPSPQRDAWLRAWARAFPAIVAEAGPAPLPADLIFPELLDEPDHAPQRLRALWRAREAAELRALLSEHLGEDDPHIPDLIAHTLSPAVALAPARSGPIQLGGLPELPEGTDWPAPLSLLAQLDLATLPALSALPREGRLLFFFDLTGDGGGQVRWVTAPATRRAAPPGVVVLPQRTASPQRSQGELPHIETPFYGPYHDKLWGLGPWMQPSLGSEAPRPRDRLLGFADPLQSDPYVQCALTARGLPLSTPVDAALLSDAAGWRLLLQADSDPESGVYLGDMGAVYFFIRPADLTARRFSAVCAVWQGY